MDSENNSTFSNNGNFNVESQRLHHLRLEYNLRKLRELSRLRSIPLLQLLRQVQIRNNNDIVREMSEFLSRKKALQARLPESEVQRWQVNSLMKPDNGSSPRMPCFPRQTFETEVAASTPVLNYLDYPVRGGLPSLSYYADQCPCWGTLNIDTGSTGLIYGQNSYGRNSTNSYSANGWLNPPPQHMNPFRAREDASRRLNGLVERLSLSDDINAIFAEAKSQLASLAVHRAGSFLVQKLIEAADEDKLEEIIVALVIDDGDRSMLKNFCSDDNGNKVLVSLIERLKEYNDKQLLLMRGLCNIVAYFTTTTDCKRALEGCFSSFSYRALQILMEKIAEKFDEIATNKNGCCVIQRCLSLCLEQNDRQNINAIVSLVVRNSLNLSDDPYGNYVVQFVVDMGNRRINDQITENLKGCFGALSTNQASSNVVETLIRKSGINTVVKIVDEIAHCPDLLRILQDKYGNYVAQTALRVSKKRRLSVYEELYNFIIANFVHLEAHVIGYNVLRAV